MKGERSHPSDKNKDVARMGHPARHRWFLDSIDITAYDSTALLLLLLLLHLL